MEGRGCILVCIGALSGALMGCMAGMVLEALLSRGWL